MILTHRMYYWSETQQHFLGTITYDYQRPWVYGESRDRLIVTDFWSMWMMVNLFDLWKYFIGECLQDGSQPDHD